MFYFNSIIYLFLSSFLYLLFYNVSTLYLFRSWMYSSTQNLFFTFSMIFSFNICLFYGFLYLRLYSINLFVCSQGLYYFPSLFLYISFFNSIYYLFPFLINSFFIGIPSNQDIFSFIIFIF